MTTIRLVSTGKVIVPKTLRKPPAGLREGTNFQGYDCTSMTINKLPIPAYKYKDSGICYYFKWEGQWYSVPVISRLDDTGIDGVLEWDIPVSGLLIKL
jgi:hypothetical protein